MKSVSVKNKTALSVSLKLTAVTGMLTAINIAFSSLGIPVPGGHFYLNDVIICTAALLLDPLHAFVVGGIGAFLGDFFFYPAPMFVSLTTHGLQAVVISVLSHPAVKSRPAADSPSAPAERKPESPEVRAALSVTVGACIMVAGYSLGRAFLYSTPQYALMKLPYQILQAAVGAVASVILCFRCRIREIFRRTCLE
jgi:uncharacterized membrane protein